jgi:hypothetical protein
MPDAEPSRGGGGILGFVHAVFGLERGGQRGHRNLSAAQRGGDVRGVDSAGQEDALWLVAHDRARDRVIEAAANALHDLRGRLARRVRCQRGPVPFELEEAPTAPHGDMGGRDATHAAGEGARRRRHAEREIRHGGFRIQRARRAAEQRRQFRAEEDRLVAGGHEEAPVTEVIARQQEFPRAAVPDRERERAAHVRKSGAAALEQIVEDGRRAGTRQQAGPARRRIAASAASEHAADGERRRTAGLIGDDDLGAEDGEAGVRFDPPVRRSGIHGPRLRPSREIGRRDRRPVAAQDCAEDRVGEPVGFHGRPYSSANPA